MKQDIQNRLQNYLPPILKEVARFESLIKKHKFSNPFLIRLVFLMLLQTDDTKKKFKSSIFKKIFLNIPIMAKLNARYNGEYSVNDVVDFGMNLLSSDKIFAYGKFDIIKTPSAIQTYFKQTTNYTFQCNAPLFLISDSSKERIRLPMNTSQIHPVTLSPLRYTVAWIRFSLMFYEETPAIVIDEIQSLHKQWLNESELMEGWEEHLLSNFIRSCMKKFKVYRFLYPNIDCKQVLYDSHLGNIDAQKLYSEMPKKYGFSNVPENFVDGYGDFFRYLDFKENFYKASGKI